jgi:hypothetical protein
MKKPIQFRLETELIDEAKSFLEKYEDLTNFITQAIKNEILTRKINNKELNKMNFEKLGQLISKKEKETNANSFAIINNIMHNVNQVNEEKYKNAGKMLRNALTRYGIEFEIPEDDIKVDWNLLQKGYFSEAAKD